MVNTAPGPVTIPACTDLGRETSRFAADRTICCMVGRDKCRRLDPLQCLTMIGSLLVLVIGARVVAGVDPTASNSDLASIFLSMIICWMRCLKCGGLYIDPANIQTTLW